MRSLQKCLPTRRERLFIKNVDDKPVTPEGMIEGWLREIGDSPEALRGAMFSLETTQLIVQGMYEAGVEMGVPAYMAATHRMYLMILNLRVELADHPYMQEALAILKESDNVDG